MNPKQQLNSIRGHQKLQSLKAREEALDKREALFDDRERLNHLAVLDKQIAIKEETKAILDRKVETHEQELQEYSEQIALQKEKLDREIIKLQENYNVKVNQQERLEAKLEEITRNIRVKREELQTQNRYVSEQQSHVDTTIAEMNVQLQGLQAEGDTLQEEKKAICADIIRLDQDKQRMSEEVDVYKREFDNLQQGHAHEVELAKQELEDIYTMIGHSRNDLQQLTLEQEGKIQALKIREQAIKVKETELLSKENDLRDREKRLNLRLNLTRV